MTTVEFIEKYSVARYEYNELDYENSIQALTENRIEKLELLVESVEKYRKEFINDEAIKLIPSRIKYSLKSNESPQKKETLNDIILLIEEIIRSHDIEKASKALCKDEEVEIMNAIILDRHICFLITRIQWRIEDKKVLDESGKQENNSKELNNPLLEMEFRALKNAIKFEKIFFKLNEESSQSLVSALYWLFFDSSAFSDMQNASSFFKREAKKRFVNFKRLQTKDQIGKSALEQIENLFNILE